jgi:hypothetical protein
MQSAFKAGIGMLLAEAKPLALPFYHYGMQHVLPVGAVRPRSGHTVRLAFGDAVDCDGAWISRAAARHASAETSGPDLWRAIAAETYEALATLERAVHPLANAPDEAEAA